MTLAVERDGLKSYRRSSKMQQSKKKHNAACILLVLLGVTLTIKLCVSEIGKRNSSLSSDKTFQDQDQSQNDDISFDFSHVQPPSSAHEQNIAVQNLLQRVVGEQVSEKFNVTISKEKDYGGSGNDAFHLYKQGGELVHIEATSASAAAAGIHHYLKHYLHCHISWDYDQLNMPSVFPDVDIHVQYPERFRLFSNVCTSSYSYVWWDWTRWEREIDRWALTGINLAYAGTGMEGVWTKVYKQLGLSQEDIDEHFSGPAFLAWNRMGNLRGWGGPLSQAWHVGQGLLQRRILARMRELAITPILPAFAGIVPVAFKRLFPNAKLSPLGKWCRFDEQYCCPLLLDPTDELFKTISTKFLREVTAQFGTNHMYSADTFNENLPPSGDLDYLRNASQGIYQAMRTVDPNAVWVLQGWFFVNEIFFWTEDRVEAFLTAVPQGKILVLDLFAEQIPSHERLHSYYGQPYVWCMLHNFGGTLGMHGSFRGLNQGVSKARNCTGSMVGLGMVPEGIDQNYAVYDFMSDVFWSPDPLNISDWVALYARRRYGADTSTSIVQAWQIMKDTLYSYNGSLGALHGQYKISTRPSLKWKPETWYDTELLFKAWGLVLNSSQALNDSANFKHDVVDLTRQCLQVLFFHSFEQMLRAFQAANVPAFQSASNKLIQILNDLEQILASEKKFLLGVWVKAAKSTATNTSESHLFELNARNQITLWGPKGEIVDYGTKQWSGIVRSYYLPRWHLFLSRLNASLVQNVPFDEAAYLTDVLNGVEKPFSYSLDSFPDGPTGNPLEIAKRIYGTLFRYKSA